MGFRSARSVFISFLVAVPTLGVVLTVLLQSSGSRPFKTFVIGKPVLSVALSNDGQLLAAGLVDGTIQIRGTSDGNIIATLTGRQSEVNVVAFSPDGQLLASGDGGENAEIRVWNLSGGTSILNLTGHKYAIETLAFSPDGEIVASGGRDNKIRLWRIDDGQLLSTLTGRPPPVLGNVFIRSLVFDMAGRTLLVGAGDDTVQSWRVPEGELFSTQEGYTNQLSHSSSARSMSIDPQGQRVATALRSIPEVFVWSLRDGKALYTLRSHRTDIWSLAFSPDGQLLASGGGRSAVSDDWLSPHDMSIRIWQADSGQEKARLIGHSDSVKGLAWSPDGKHLASGSDDGTVRLWQVK